MTTATARDTDCRFLTIHTVTELPFHNLNRDQAGLPKNFQQGGVTRAMLSSQSIKRAARVAFEAGLDPELAAKEKTSRSRYNSNYVAKLAKELAENTGVTDFDYEAAKITANISIRAISANANTQTKKVMPSSSASTDLDQLAVKPDRARSDAEGENDNNDNAMLLSMLEIDTLVNKLVATRGYGYEEDGKTIAKKMPTDGITLPLVIEPGQNALPVAAFGRMAAASPELGVEAAISVSPAVTTHAAEVTFDYFSAVDDRMVEIGGVVAAHLNTSAYTSGVYYRSFTIDRKQLRKNWRGADGEHAEELIAAMIRLLITALPRGRSTNTGAAPVPSLVIAETQSHRVTYDFQKPVPPSYGEGGYLHNTAKRVTDKIEEIEQFDPELVTQRWSYRAPELEGLDFGTNGSFSDLVARAAQWVVA